MVTLDSKSCSLLTHPYTAEVGHNFGICVFTKDGRLACSHFVAQLVKLEEMLLSNPNPGTMFPLHLRFSFEPETFWSVKNLGSPEFPRTYLPRDPDVIDEGVLLKRTLEKPE